MNKSVQKVFLSTLTGFMFLASPAWGDNLRDSVVKVFVTSNRMDYYHPWQSRGSSSMSGSGSIISGNRILTNAHVVSDHTFIQVRKESNPKKYTAKLAAIGHDCDLAILTVDDPEFFEGVIPVEFGELPQLQDTVTVIGFPRGGDKLSITEGVVSRVEITAYTQSAKKLLAVQIDAAINPGNSGGPVFKDGKLVGVAMQVITSSQNIGYMIPSPIINHFLDDLGDGDYSGFPTLGIAFHNTENKTLRKFYRMKENEGGVLITTVLPYSSAYGILKEGDVVLEIDGVPIEVDGTFAFRENERLNLSYLINKKQIGRDIVIKFIRDGQAMTQTVQFDRFVGLVPYPHHFEKPPYYITGGLIFTVLSTDLLKSWGKTWWEKAPLDFMYYLAGEGNLNEKKKREIVVLLAVLPDDVNVGYHGYHNDVIAKVNGKEFDSFKEFVTLLENNKMDYSIFETTHKRKIVLNNKDIGNITQKILERNHIPSQFSDDVAGWLGKDE